MTALTILEKAADILEGANLLSVDSEFVKVLLIGILIFGVINCILGYHLLRFWMMVFGFCIGAGLGVFVAIQMGQTTGNILAAAAIGVGAVLAVISFLVYRAGIFIIGAGIGLTLSIYLIHPTSSFTFFLCLLAGTALGVLALRFDREVIIVGTSFLGGCAGGFSLGRLLRLEELPFGLLLSALFAFFGMFLQFIINPTKGRRKHPEAEMRRKSSSSTDRRSENRCSDSRPEEYTTKDPEEWDEQELEDAYYDAYFAGKNTLDFRKKPETPSESEEDEEARLHRMAWDKKRNGKQTGNTPKITGKV